MQDKTEKWTPLTATGGRTWHPLRENISFGRWAMPVMAEKMQDPDPVNRKRAVQSLRDYVFDSRRVASKEFTSVVPLLKNLHRDEDKEVRLKVAECLGAIAASAAGRQTFEKNDFYEETLKLVEDEDESVRQNAIIAVHRVISSPICVESMVKAGAIRVLRNRIPNESESVLVTVLEALHSCCLVDRKEALELECLYEVIPLLDNPSSQIRTRAALVIKELTVEEEGRNEAVELFAVTPLVDLCSDENDRVKAKALAALMMIVNSPKGKSIALEYDAIPKIVPLTKHVDVEIRLNTIKVLTALGETLSGRKQLKESIYPIFTILNDCEEVKKAALKLVEVVTFKP